MALRGRFPRARGRGGCAGVRRSSRTHAAYLKIAFSGRALASEVSPLPKSEPMNALAPLWQMAAIVCQVCTAHAAAPVGRPHGSSCTRRGPRNSPERRRPRATAAGGPLGVLAQAGPILGVARALAARARARVADTDARARARRAVRKEEWNHRKSSEAKWGGKQRRQGAAASGCGVGGCVAAVCVRGKRALR